MFRFGMVLLSSGFPNELCVTPPKEREADFREVLADFDQRKAKPRELKPSFSIRKPYVLLDKKGVNAFRAKRFHTPEGQVLDERFQGATDLFLYQTCVSTRNTCSR